MENDHYVAFQTLAGLTGFGFAKRTSNLDRLLFHYLRVSPALVPRQHLRKPNHTNTYSQAGTTCHPSLEQRVSIVLPSIDNS
jgi:hypothetical protein